MTVLSQEILDTLLYKNESEQLDFKRDQYLFEKASDDDKGELVKDIVAFANAWKTSEAHILIGVEEVKGARANVVGVSHHIDDAKIQQLVNSKTNTPVKFSYLAVEIDGKPVGILQIEKEQDRPVFLAKDSGKLKKGVVYIRRGSSTDEARPDEIASMGAARVQHAIALPDLELAFAVPGRKQCLGRSIRAFSVILSDDDGPTLDSDEGKAVCATFGELRECYHRPPDRSPFALSDPFNRWPTNEELRHYYEYVAAFASLGFHLRNKGAVVAMDCRAEVNILKTPKVLIMDGCRFPSNPWDNPLMNIPLVKRNGIEDLSVEDYGDHWRVVVPFGKVQPQGESWSEGNLYLLHPEDAPLRMTAAIFADNIPRPQTVTLTHETVVHRLRYESDFWNRYDAAAINNTRLFEVIEEDEQ